MFARQHTQQAPYQQQHVAPGAYGAPGVAGPYQPQYPAAQYGASAAAPGYYSAAPPTAYPATSVASVSSQGTVAYAAPQIRNPFPAPSTSVAGAGAGSDYDPEMAAQIAQWQSAYTTPRTGDAGADGGKGKGGGAQQYGAGAGAYAGYGYGTQGWGGADGAHGEGGADGGGEAGQQQGASGQDGSGAKKKTVIREGGGKRWTDDTLAEWDPSHFRLFVGNLAGETTDDSLLKAFSRWKSVQKARVIRDKRTTKSKGFGFVSFSDADDFFQAAKEMNGKYIQSHPVIVKRSTTEIKLTNQRDLHQQHGGKHGKGGKNVGSGIKNKGSGSGKGGDGGAAVHTPQLGPHGSGITKPGQKTKGGLKLIG